MNLQVTIMTREENLAGIVDQLTEMGFPKTALYEYLDSCMGMPSIPYDYRKRIGDDLMDYHLTITQDKASGLYHPEGYQAILLQTHPIAHSVIAGIDTRELEGRLKAIDWNGYVPRKSEPGSDVFKAVVDVVNLGLWETKEAADISSRLELRYWLNTPVEQDLRIRNHINDYQKSHYFPIKNDFSDIHPNEAYNLLSGRAVLKFQEIENKPGHFNSHWKVLENGKLETLPDYDFMAALRLLPIPEIRQDITGPQIIYNFIRGDRVPVTLLDGNKTTPVFLEANPRDQSIKIYNRDMVRIYPQKIQPKEEQQPLIQKQVPTKKRSGKNKGRSI